MNAADKHYKCINSQTDYTIYYHSLSADKSPEEVKAELDKVKARVATQNKVYQGTLYWEEIKDRE